MICSPWALPHNIQKVRPLTPARFQHNLTIDCVPIDAVIVTQRYNVTGQGFPEDAKGESGVVLFEYQVVCALYHCVTVMYALCDSYVCIVGQLCMHCVTVMYALCDSYVCIVCILFLIHLLLVLICVPQYYSPTDFSLFMAANELPSAPAQLVNGNPEQPNNPTEPGEVC